MKPSGNENKGAMKLRVDFKQKKPGDLLILFKGFNSLIMLEIQADQV